MAVKAFAKALKENPKDTSSQHNLSLALYELGEYDISIKISSALLKLKEPFLKNEAMFNRGNCNQKLGKFKEAIDDFTEIIKTSPQESSAYYNRANAYEKLGQFAEAENDRLTVKRLEGNQGLRHYHKAPKAEDISDLQLDTFLKTIKNIEETKNLDLSTKYFELGNAYVRIREFKKAIQFFEKASEHHPISYHSEAHYNIIACKIDLKTPNDLLLHEIDSFLDKNPNHKEILRLKADVISEM